MLDFLPRFVLPDGTVVMPEQVWTVYRTRNDAWFVEWEEGDSPLATARRDRQTGMPDQNGKIIFERDILQASDGRQFRVHQSYNGLWLVIEIGREEGGSDPLYAYQDCAITGFVPYKEDTDE